MKRLMAIFARHPSRLLMLFGLLGCCAQVPAAQLKAIGYHKLPDGQLVLNLQLDGIAPTPATFSTHNPPRIVLDLPATGSALAHKTIPVASALVHSVSTVQAQGKTRVVLNLPQPIPYAVRVAGKKIHVQLGRSQTPAQQKPEQRYTGDPLSLNFQNIAVRSVLQLLADFTGLNMVVSDTVNGNITLRLKHVPWDQAMDIILKAKGLSMRREENVILVAPTEELAAREKLELESQIQIAGLAPLRSELIQVKYAKATDLAALLKSTENRLLSERGNATIDERTNTLLVQDTPHKLLELRNLIGKLDVPIRQVLIESRIVIANDDFAKDLGVRLGADYLDKGPTNIGFGGGLPGNIAWDPSVGQTAIENPTGSGNQALLVNLPQTLAAASGGAINFVLGKAGQHLLRLELSAMQQEGRGEIISSPRVITSDQNKAIIKQGVEIPYQEATSSGATSVAFKEAVLRLEVTPHITPDDRVIMDLKVNKDNPDFTRAVLGVPPVDTRELKTSVLVENGETVVLGGVFERTRARSTSKVPLFGDLPVIGGLFRQEQIQDENSELLIFVTPKILDTGQSLREASQRRLQPLQ